MSAEIVSIDAPHTGRTEDDEPFGEVWEQGVTAWRKFVVAAGPPRTAAYVKVLIDALPPRLGMVAVGRLVQREAELTPPIPTLDEQGAPPGTATSFVEDARRQGGDDAVIALMAEALPSAVRARLIVEMAQRCLVNSGE